MKNLNLNHRFRGNRSVAFKLNQTPRKQTMKTKLILAALLLAAIQIPVFAQGTAFSYQGRLNTNGVPTTGLYDFQFYLRDALTGGSPVGTTNSRPGLGVTNGVFGVTLDFGSAAFSGAARWLEITVRTNGGIYTNLSPRQPLLAVPYAITASNLTGTLPTTQLNGPLNAATLSGSVPTASLTAVPAAGLTGFIDDNRLSANVALRGNVNSFTANNSFAAAIVGGWPSPVVWVQNSSPSAPASPALTLQGVGNSVDGVLAVRSTGVGYLARFFTGNGPAVDITTNGSVTMNGGLVVDGAAVNSGSLNPGANFGNGGEGISSKRNVGGNQYGLDFFTAGFSRLSISNNGTINASGLLKAPGGLVIQTINGSDPSSPVTGQIWLRTDL